MALYTALSCAYFVGSKAASTVPALKTLFTTVVGDHAEIWSRTLSREWSFYMRCWQAHILGWRNIWIPSTLLTSLHTKQSKSSRCPIGSTVDTFPQVSVASASECVVICNIPEKISDVPPHVVEVNKNLPLLALPSAKKWKKQLQVQKL